MLKINISPLIREISPLIGYEAWFERPSIMRHPGFFDPVVVCRKPRLPKPASPAQGLFGQSG